MNRHSLLLLFIFLTACTDISGRLDVRQSGDRGEQATFNGGGDATTEASERQSGAALYSTYCSSCHGAEAEGTPTFPHSIAGYAPIDDIVASGRGTMPAVDLPAEDVTKIQEFLDLLGTPVEELDGSGLYSRYCSSCHGADASGGDGWEGSIQGYEPIENIVVDGRGEMESISMSVDNIAKIQEWLSSLATPTADLDGAGIYARYCSTCHGADATGGIAWPGSIEAYEPIEDIVLNGRGTMPSIEISIDDVAKVQAFLLTLATPTERLDGAGVYARYCATCHGADANGGPEWTGSIRAYDPIEEIVLNGRGEMDAIPIDAAATARVQAYLNGLGTPTSQLDGAGIYARYCSTCHGADANGGTEWTGSIAAYEPIADIVTNGRGMMDPIALDATDIDKVQAYLLTLAVPTSQLDGAGIYARYCSTCHGDDATGGTDWSGSIQGYEPIADIVLNGRGAMDPIPIDQAAVDKVQTWLSGLGTPTANLDGAGLFDRYCSTCHGADATGGTDWNGSIQGYEPIEEIVLNGRGTMAAVPVDAGQVAEIQAYLLTLAPPLSSLTGPEVYDRLCVSCHGDRGEGIAAMGMQLRYDDEPFSRYWIRNGRTTSAFASDMPSYPQNMVSDQQITEMFDWINMAPRPTTGEGLYTQYCGNCHGATAGGGPADKNIRGEDEGDVVRSGKGGTNYGSRRNYMTSWSTAQLSDSEVNAIFNYTNGL